MKEKIERSKKIVVFLSDDEISRFEDAANKQGFRGLSAFLRAGGYKMVG